MSIVHRKASIADVVQSVLSCDAGGRLTLPLASEAVTTALRSVIGLNCINGNTLDIDLGNGHVLQCNLKQAPAPGTI